MVGYHFNYVIFFPLQLAIAVGLTYYLLKISCLVGLGVIVVLLGLSYIVNFFLLRVSDKVMAKKDKRLQNVTEAFSQIRFVKANAWEKDFYKKMDKARNQELYWLRRSKLLSNISGFLYALMSPLVLSAMFLLYTYLKNELTPSTAFSTIMVFGAFEYCLCSFGEHVSYLGKAWNSLRRIG